MSWRPVREALRRPRSKASQAVSLERRESSLVEFMLGWDVWIASMSKDQEYGRMGVPVSPFDVEVQIRKLERWDGVLARAANCRHDCMIGT